MAIALARSFGRWNSDTDIRFTIVTDRPVAYRPTDLGWVNWHVVTTDSVGAGFTAKLQLDRLAPTDRSLFIDADCLCVRSLEPVFSAFEGHSVSVVGRQIHDGEWFGDVAGIARQLNIAGYPRFNGGIYYLERGETATRVYECARALLPRYDELGFVRLRGKENDEVLMAVSLVLQGQTAIPDDGSIMNTTLAAPGGVRLDVLKGDAVLLNPKTHPRHNDWYDLEVMQPALVHFPGEDVSSHPYRTEILALELVASSWPDSAARLYSRLFSEVPSLVAHRAREVLRPIYRRVFGARRMKPSSR
jgi:hypothetical protein